MSVSVRMGVWAIVALAITVPSFAEHQPFSRYQSIVDRQMFGVPPPGFDPTKPPSEVSAKEERAKEQELTKEQEQLKSAIHFSVINVTPSGSTAVGFTDKSNAKEPKHYYLKVGESRDGWTVKEADALKATMTIVKGDIEVSLTLGGNSASGGGTRRAGAAAAPSNAGRANQPTGVRRPNMLGGLGSLRTRRMQREQQRAAAEKAAAEKAAAEKEAAAAKEAEREAEREREKAERDKEREEQRAQLLQIQEELKRTREEKQKAEAAKADEKDEGDGE